MSVWTNLYDRITIHDVESPLHWLIKGHSWCSSAISPLWLSALHCLMIEHFLIDWLIWVRLGEKREWKTGLFGIQRTFSSTSARQYKVLKVLIFCSSKWHQVLRNHCFYMRLGYSMDQTVEVRLPSPWLMSVLQNHKPGDPFQFPRWIQEALFSSLPLAALLSIFTLMLTAWLDRMLLARLAGKLTVERSTWSQSWHIFTAWIFSMWAAAVANMCS